MFWNERERYTRIIKTGQLRYRKGELDKLEQLTGISKKIFEGEERFICHIGKSEKSAISDEEWKKLLSDETIASKERKSCQQKLHEKLKRANRDDLSTWHFQRLCYFLKERKAAPLQPPDQTIRGIQKAIRNLTFDLAEQCDTGHLQALYKLLKVKYTMVSRIVLYRAEKESARYNPRDKDEEEKATNKK